MTVVSEKATISSVDLPKTICLVNNFVFNTGEFLNTLSEACERKIAGVSSKITQLETLVSVLEAKLNSLPSDMGGSAKVAPAAPPPPPNSSSSSSSAAAAPPPPPPGAAAEGGAPVENDVVAVAAPEEEEEDPNTIAAKDHPDYAQFFKLQKLRVPQPVLEQKMAAAGLDSSILMTPDKRIPK